MPSRGVPTKAPEKLITAIYEGAILAGRNGEGEDGMRGYCHRLAVHYPKSYVTLLAKLLPNQITTPPDGPLVVQTRIIDAATEAAKAQALEGLV